MDKRMSRMAFFFTVLDVREGTLFIKTIVYYANYFLIIHFLIHDCKNVCSYQL